jgi:Ni2+-binding GTPase involved in maturation of urease and hydrogenase
MEFNMEKTINECRSLNREVLAFPVSAKTGAGMDAFYEYLSSKL